MGNNNDRRADLAPMVKPVGWQPIATAPKDGTYILIKLMNDEVFSAQWQVGNKCWHGSHSDIGPFNPVSWTHIPGDAAAPITPAQEARFVIEYLERETGVTFGDMIGTADKERIKAIAEDV